jgi:hypothetical protein
LIKLIIAKPVPIILAACIKNLVLFYLKSISSIYIYLNNNKPQNNASAASYNDPSDPNTVPGKIIAISTETQDMYGTMTEILDVASANMIKEDAAVIMAGVEEAKKEAELYNSAVNTKIDMLMDKETRSEDKPVLVKEIIELDTKNLEQMQKTMTSIDSAVHSKYPEAINSEGLRKDYDELKGNINSNFTERNSIIAKYREDLVAEANHDAEIAAAERAAAENAAAERAVTEKESDKRKRDDSDSENEGGAPEKRQRPDTGSLVADYADTSTEFPGYTDGDD